MLDRAGSLDDRRPTLVSRRDVQHAGFRIDRAALPVRAAGHVRQHQHAAHAVGARDDRRREERTELVLRGHLQRLRLQLRREVDQIVERDALPIERRRLGRERLRRRGFSPGTSDCGTGRSSIGHTGWPVARSKT